MNYHITNARRMYTAESEIGKMKLQAVTENLYEATTKVIQYSIEMYAKKPLTTWVQNDLIENIDKVKNLVEFLSEFREGNIRKIDITNGCLVIENFVRTNALNEARQIIQNKISTIDKDLIELERKKKIVELRMQLIENLEDEKVNRYDFCEDIEKQIDISTEEECVDEEDDGQIDEYARYLYNMNNLDDVEEEYEKLQSEKSFLCKRKNDLKEYFKQGKDLLGIQGKDEKEALIKLRQMRNGQYAHRNVDEESISDIGSWEPEAGALFQWSTCILEYISVIAKRYVQYELFDEYYASKERKELFDSCKIFVQKQMRELYVNHTNTVIEFAGELFERDDDKYNFGFFIRTMAEQWESGIRLVSIVDNTDMPELNQFFKECLSGTNGYIDKYLFYRKLIRQAWEEGNMDRVNTCYFALIYALNPKLKKIYWSYGHCYSKKQYALQILYKLIKTKNYRVFIQRLENYNKYLDGINIRIWCEEHILSRCFFRAKEDDIGEQYALKMENAMIALLTSEECKKYALYKICMKETSKLYFYMIGKYEFSYTTNKGKKVVWNTYKEFTDYIENGKNFNSFRELYDFVNNVCSLEYFKVWKKLVKD